MYKVMSIREMQEEFNSYNRENYFSDEGLEFIDNYYIDCYSSCGEIETAVEFDVVAICCDWNEYGNGVVLDFDDFINDFEYLIDDEDEELEEDEKIDAIYQKLEEKHIVLN